MVAAGAGIGLGYVDGPDLMPGGGFGFEVPEGAIFVEGVRGGAAAAGEEVHAVVAEGGDAAESWGRRCGDGVGFEGCGG